MHAKIVSRECDGAERLQDSRKRLSVKHLRFVGVVRECKKDFSVRYENRNGFVYKLLAIMIVPLRRLE